MPKFSKRIFTVMLWELWRVSRWDLLLRAMGLLSLLFFLFIVLRTTTLDEFQQQLFRALALILVGVSSVFSTIWLNSIENRPNGFTFRLGFFRPVSTFQLVAVPMAYCMVTTMLFYWLSILTVSTLFQLEMPSIFPALFLGCSVSIFVGVVWSSLHSIEKIIGIFVALMLIIGLLVLRFHRHVQAESILFALGGPGDFELTWYDSVVMASISILAFTVSVFAVSRQRCGEGWSWSRPLTSFVKTVLNADLVKAFASWLNNKTNRPEFRNSIAVQFWFEIRRSLTQLYAISALNLLVLTLIAVMPLINKDWAGGHAVHMWIGAMLFIPFVCQLLVVDSVIGLRQQQGQILLSKYDATRPLRCDQKIAVKLLVVSGWSLLCLLGIVAIAAVHTTLAGNWQHWQSLEQQIVGWAGQALSQLNVIAGQPPSVPDSNSVMFSPLSWLIFFGNLVVLYCVSTAMLMTWSMWLSFYRKTFMVANTLILSQFVVVAILAANGWSLKPLLLAYGYVIPSLIIAGAIAMFIRAVSSRLLTGRYLAGVLAVWLITVTTWAALIVEFQGLFSSVPLSFLAILAALAAALGALASAASTPLAYAAFRHQ
jgi:hypothetical protein